MAIKKYAWDDLNTLKGTTDWSKFDALKNDEIDCSDIPEMDEKTLKNAALIKPIS